MRKFAKKRPTTALYISLLVTVVTLLFVFRPARPVEPPAEQPKIEVKVQRKKVVELEQRLDSTTQQAEAALRELALAPDDARRDVLRRRVEVLYRLEAALEADIAAARMLLARVDR